MKSIEETIMEYEDSINAVQKRVDELTERLAASNYNEGFNVLKRRQELNCEISCMQDAVNSLKEWRDNNCRVVGEQAN